MFPNIESVDDILEAISDHKEINVMTQPNGFMVACYSIATPTTFLDPDPIKQAILRECRGITFGPDGKIACRPLHKFFNVGENDQVQLANLDISPSNISRFMSKLDGSMLTPVLMLDGSVILKSKKSFTSDVAILATNYLRRNKKLYDFCDMCVHLNLTPIFEYTSPQNRIVLNYNKEELRLLHVRNNVTGKYVTDVFDAETLQEDGIMSVDNFENIEEKISEIEKATDIEGYVIQFKSGEMVKWKTPWYVLLHRTVTFVRERDIAEMVINETTDDFKAYLASVNASDSIVKVETIESEIATQLLEMQTRVEELFEGLGDLSRKDIALKYKGTPYFNLLMSKFSGKEPNYKDYYSRKYLKEDYGLEQI